MPRVAMKAGTLLFAIKKPFTEPIRQPMTSAARMPIRKAGKPVMPAAVSRPVG